MTLKYCTHYTQSSKFTIDAEYVSQYEHVHQVGPQIWSRCSAGPVLPLWVGLTETRSPLALR